MTQEDSGGEKNLANPGRCSENKCTGYQKSLSKIICRFFFISIDLIFIDLIYFNFLCNAKKFDPGLSNTSGCVDINLKEAWLLPDKE